MLIFDIAVILIQIPFSPVPQLLYGIVAIIIQVMVLDKVLLWGESRTEVKLISTKADELCAAILHQLDRSVTILNGAGASPPGKAGPRHRPGLLPHRQPGHRGAGPRLLHG